VDVLVEVRFIVSDLQQFLLPLFCRSKCRFGILIHIADFVHLVVFQLELWSVQLRMLSSCASLILPQIDCSLVAGKGLVNQILRQKLMLDDYLPDFLY
jgi:hypothetical protein